MWCIGELLNIPLLLFIFGVACVDDGVDIKFVLFSNCDNILMNYIINGKPLLLLYIDDILLLF